MSDNLILLVGCSLLLILFLCMSSSLRFLNFSQLKDKYKGDAYKALLKQLENRDEVQLIAEFFVLSAALFEAILIFKLCGDDALMFFSLIPILVLVMVLLPLLLFAPWAERILVEMMFLYLLLESIPFAVRMSKKTRSLGLYFAGESDSESHSLELEHLLSEGEAEGRVDSEEKAMLEGVIELKNMMVREVMTPWAEVEYLSDDATVQEGVALSSEKGLSRIPIYDSSKDKVEGIFFVRDVLQKIVNSRDVLSNGITQHMRQVPVVPETRFVRNLLVTMSKSRNQMLMILDEYGSLTGLVTLEDILEEIVGDIRDEYVEDDEEIDVIDEKSADVLGSTRLDEVNESLQIDLTQGSNFESLAGYLLQKLQRIPRKGEAFDFENCRFLILIATGRKIVKIRVEKLLKLDRIPITENKDVT